MAVYTVRQLLQDIARPGLVLLSSDPDLTSAERNVAAGGVPVVDSVLADLNAQNIIPQAGRRNAAVTNLRDQVKTPLGAVDRAHQDFVAVRLYNILDAISAAISLIGDQVPSDARVF